jgi:hypothetical protein
VELLVLHPNRHNTWLILPRHIAMRCRQNPLELRHASASWVLEVQWDLQMSRLQILWPGMVLHRLRLGITVARRIL